jgi:hypothetical protein
MATYLAGLSLGSRILEIIHALLGSDSIGSSQHFDKSMSLVLVDYASLDLAEAAEDVSNLTFSSTCATYKERATEHSDVIARQTMIPFHIPRLTVCTSRWTWLSAWRRWRALAVLITFIAPTSSFTAPTTTLTTFKSVRSITLTGSSWVVDTIRWALATVGWRFTTRRTTTMVVRRSATVSESTIVLIISLLLSAILCSHLCLLLGLWQRRGLWRWERRPSVLCHSQSI